jgi:hypothetical protein
VVSDRACVERALAGLRNEGARQPAGGMHVRPKGRGVYM